MIRTKIFYADKPDLESSISSHNGELKKQILSSLGYTDMTDNKARRWIDGINNLIDEGNLTTRASQIAFNALPEVLHLQAFSEYADWEDFVYWDLATALEELKANIRLIGYLKMLFYGRRIDQNYPDVEKYALLNDTDSTNQFEEIARHCFLTQVEVQELDRLLKEAPLSKLNEDLQEFLSEELQPALAKAIILDKGMLLIIK